MFKKKEKRFYRIFYGLMRVKTRPVTTSSHVNNSTGKNRFLCLLIIVLVTKTDTAVFREGKKTTQPF